MVRSVFKLAHYSGVIAARESGDHSPPMSHRHDTFSPPLIGDPQVKAFPGGYNRNDTVSREKFSGDYSVDTNHSCVPDVEKHTVVKTC